MNFRLVFQLLGWVSAALGAAFLFCAGLAYVFRGNPGEDRALIAFLLAALTAISTTVLLTLLGRGAPSQIFRKEALTLVGLSWILASLLGMIPYLWVLPGAPVANALFESTSGLTTTGASVLSSLENLPASLLFWRQVSQWFGGMGVIVFFVAILGHLGAGGKFLFSNESTANKADFEQGRVQSVVFRLFAVYLVVSVFCLIFIRLCGLSWWESLLHMFSTVATGGFSTRSGSVADFANPALEWVMIVFMIIGSLSFFFLIALARRQWQAWNSFSEIRVYLLLLLLGTLAVTGSLFVSAMDSAHWTDTLRMAAFQVVSLASTSGFSTADYDQWPVFTHALLLFFMLVGGCSASTAGGLKVARLMVGVKIVLHSLERSYRTHVVRPVIVNGRPLDQRFRDDVLIYFVILVLILVFSILLVSLMENNLGLEGVISAVIATLFNIGPGFGEVGPTRTFAPLSEATKVYLSFLMILGRIELFALLVLFTPGLWRRFD